MSRRVPREHLVFLDGLRAIGALAVVLHHGYLDSQWGADVFARLPDLAHLFMWGKYGVPLFIVISGFILGLPLAQGRVSVSAEWARDFMRRRVRRILPPYFVALVIFSVLAYLWPNVLGFSVRAVLSHVVMLQNVDDTVFAIDGPMWSVATEFQIYILFALFLAWAWMRWGGLVVCVLATVPSLALHFVVPQLDRGHLWLLAAFTMGLLAAEIASSETTVRTRRLAGAMTVAGLAGGALLFAFDRPEANRYDWLTETVLGAGCAGLLLWLVLLQRDGIRSRVLGVVGWPPLVAVGLAAYSIYLIHDPVVALVASALASVTSDPGLLLALCFVIAVPISLAASGVFHVFVERRYMNSHMRDMIRHETPAEAVAEASPGTPGTTR